MCMAQPTLHVAMVRQPLSLACCKTSRPSRSAKSRIAQAIASRSAAALCGTRRTDKFQIRACSSSRFGASCSRVAFFMLHGMCKNTSSSSVRGGVKACAPARSTMKRLMSTKRTGFCSPAPACRICPDIGSTPRRNRWRYTRLHPRPVPQMLPDSALWPLVLLLTSGVQVQRSAAALIRRHLNPVTDLRNSVMAALRLSRSTRFATQPVNSATWPRSCPIAG